MSSVPIILQPQPLAVGISYSDINGLLAIIAANMKASIQANVTFVQEFSSTPATFQGNLIFNTSTGLWMQWNAGNAAYLPLSSSVPGDTKNTFVTGDDTVNGWFVCDGRAITAIQGISQQQSSVLQTLFGVNGNLPSLSPLQTLSGLPQNASFSSINNPAVAPPTGQIAGLTFSNPPTQTEVQALAQNAEFLDESTITIQQAVASILTQSEAMLEALNGPQSSGKLITKVYAGPGL